MHHRALKLVVFLMALLSWGSLAQADETCNSPYITRLITGQEDYVYVWALGVEGIGDGFDKLVTIDVNPKSKSYGKVLGSVAVGARNEAHHMGFTDDRRFIWAGGLAEQQDLRLRHRDRSGQAQAGEDHRRPGRQDRLPRPAHLLRAARAACWCRRCPTPRTRAASPAWRSTTTRATSSPRYPMPTDNGGDGYGYDLAVNPQEERACSPRASPATHNYMRPLGDLVKDAEAMKSFGNTMVVWDLKAMKPKKVFSVPGAPLEIRWSLRSGLTARS